MVSPVLTYSRVADTLPSPRIACTYDWRLMRQRYPHPFGVLLGIAVIGGGLTLVAQDAVPVQGLDFPLVHSLEEFKARITAFSDRLPAVPGEVLVKFRQGTGTQQLARTLSVARGDVSWDDSRWIGDAMLVRAPAEHDPEGFAFVLSQQPEVEWVQPNYISWLQLVPNDTSYQRQWNLELVDLSRAWDINRPGSVLRSLCRRPELFHPLDDLRHIGRQ